MAWKPNTGQKIEELYAWVAIEKDGGEGIIGAVLSQGIVPLIGADRERIESYRQFAIHAALAADVPFKLVRFSTREILEEHNWPSSAYARKA